MEELLFGHLNSMPTLVLLLVIATMLYVLSKGADLLVDEATSISLQWGVPKVIIGATIVSLGTTLPEASVSVLAALEGNPDLALGNAVGSIIADTGLIIGLAALIGRLPVDRNIVQRQGKIQVGAGILLAVVSLPFLSPGPEGNISQLVGILFILLLLLYILMSIRWSKNSGDIEADLETAATQEISITRDNSTFITLLKLAFGIALVIGSSKVLIPSVEITAIRIGVPQSIIAATLIAFGTSLPELVTAITSVRKGVGELAVGNIVGADILNVLFVTGSAAAVTSGGLAVPANYYQVQFPAMIIILLLFRFFSCRDNDVITKTEGLVLLSAYCIYLALNYLWL